MTSGADPAIADPESSTERPDAYGPLEEASCDDQLFPLVLEAENAELIGVSTGTEHAGYEGSGYVAEFDETGDAVSFEFCVPREDYYTFEFRYANATGGAARRTIFIDDLILPSGHRIAARWSWSDWDPTTPGTALRDSALLAAGRHRVELSYEPNDTGVIEVDRLTVSRGPTPSSTSITSMLMNDWDQLVAGVFDSRIFPGDDTNRPPRIGELRWRGNWQANNVDIAAGYLRDDTERVAYAEFDDQPLRTEIVMGDDGVLRQNYLSWADEPLPAAVQKEYALAPGSGLAVVRYTLTNLTDEPRTFAILEYVDLNRTGEQDSTDLLTMDESTAQGRMYVTWRDDLQAFVADLSELHGTYVVFGAFQEPDELSAGPAGGGTTSSSGGSGAEPSDAVELSSLVSQFSENGLLRYNESFTGDDAEMAINERVALDPGQSASFAFYYAVRGDLAGAEEAARTALEESAEAWLERTSDAFNAWTAQRTPLAIDDPTLDAAYVKALVSIKHAHQPEFGSFVAATNPAYFFKVWPRDASVVAMGLDAANYLDEADAYWRWMASVQETGENEEFPDGTWWTNYSYWQADAGIPFVQPEWDSLGLFTIGVYRHYLVLREQRSEADANDFFDAVWPAVRAAANFISDEIGNNGFGPADNSIWEDRFQYAMFTQVTYASGLIAAYELARTHGEDDDEVAGWLSAARTIKGAITAPYDPDKCTGLWHPKGNYFMRGIDPDCAPDERVDGSTDLVWVFGLIDVNERQARLHRQRVLGTLAPTDYFQGISRYEGDTFYYSAVFSPGGLFESTVPETTWPQMSMYMTMAEYWLGLERHARARLDWYVSVTGAGYMPPGEGVDWATQQPLVSTAVEPVTGTWYLLALLVAAGQFEPRLDRVGFDSDI